VINTYIQERISILANKYKLRIVARKEKYIILQAKDITLRIYNDGTVRVGRKEKFRFDEKKIIKMM